MQLKCMQRLPEALAGVFPSVTLPADFTIAPEPCPEGMQGDITINCFRFARVFKSAPDAVASAVEKILSGDPDVENAVRVKAFVNVTLKASALFRDTLADTGKIFEEGFLPQEKRKRILIEFSAPNTNKPQHLGHVRNNTLGASVSALLARVGHDVVPVNLVNDRGIHICKSMLAYQRFGNGATPESTGIKGDHLVGDYYVKYNDLLKEELSELRSKHPEWAEKSDEELFLETECGAAAQEMLRKWEAGDPLVVALWKKMNSWVFAGFDATYRRQGICFRKVYLESETYLLGKSTVAEGLEKGVFQKREDGAVIADLGKLGTKVLLRSDGTSVYITQDIGTTMLKYREFAPDSMIWVVGDEQNLHFQMLFKILKAMGNDWADRLYHLSYGMVNLPTGKMKSREGTVVDADDLFDEMHRLAKEATLERVGDEIPEDLEERSEIIGMGALKFMLLKINPTTTMLFDPKASLKFEGDTGPYVQYVCARINSIARKAEERGILAGSGEADWSLLSSEEERSLAVCAAFYPETLKLAAEKLDCSALVNYLLNLAKAFNRFYREKQVLNAEDPAVAKARLALCCAVRDILSDGLKTLTIGIPQAM
ncbi:MAG: arginine--tRNA ligase [Lentisphaeria bacterium]|nr:arginine--tRNA ligase [Lentisphaeria bacterium]